MWVVPNVEHYEYLPPAGPRDPWPRTPHPDVLGYGVRDYGNRVGLWRMFDVMDHLGIRGTSSLNLAVFDHFPQILEAHEKRKWDVMAHGLYNTRYHWNMAEDAERAAIAECVESYRRHTGRQLAGWFSPAATFTREHARPRGRGGHQILLRLVSRRSAVPDPHAQRQADHDPVPDGYQRRDDLSPLRSRRAEFAQMVIDHFDCVYAEAAHRPMVMCIALHPYIMGQPHRIRHLERALGHVVSHAGVWMATGEEIADWYIAHGLGAMEAQLASEQRGAP